MTAIPDNRDANDLSTPKECARLGQDPQQPILDPTPNRRTAAATNDRDAKPGSAPTVSAHRGQGSQQPIADTATRDSPATAPTVPEQQTPRGLGSPADPQRSTGLLLWDPVLQTLADGLDDIERVRIAQANRLRILTTTAEDSDGEVRGFGLSTDHPAVAALATQLQTLDFLEKQMTKALTKQLQTHALHDWVKRNKGLGEKTVARLLASVHDPYWNGRDSRPRTVGELFAYCGVAGPDQQKRRGERVTWNPTAKMRIHLIAEGMVKNRTSAYRAVYDAARGQYADKVHTTSCRQCGSKGNPAAAGTEWRDGHKHAGALRLVKRAILRDLWSEARAFYRARECAA